MEPAKQIVDDTQPREPLVNYVRAAWQAAPGDMPGAEAALFNVITNDPDLLNEIMPQVLRAWCREQVGQFVGEIRLAAIQPVDNPSQGNRLRAAMATSLFDFPLVGGKRLGDANSQEIQASAQAYADTAQDAAHKSRWLSRVAESVGRKNRAEEALTLAKLNELFEEARHG